MLKEDYVYNIVVTKTEYGCKYYVTIKNECPFICLTGSTDSFFIFTE
jgi:hypothetical protein